MATVERIRDARPEERAALEALQRRASDVWEEYREQLAAHPDAISLAPEAIDAGQVRVAVDSHDRRLGFSVLLAARDGAQELDGLFVEPDSMRGGVGTRLIEDAVARARAQGTQRIEVVANPRAVGFYERVGFRAGGTVDTRFGPGIRMALLL